jgi:aminoglycoside/choline kinase family phosphotransferase
LVDPLSASNGDFGPELLVRRTVERDLGTEVARVEAIPGQLGLRSFFRVTLASGPIATLVARVDRQEDPAGRPAGVPPEPPLEPVRALLESHGLPVPARYGGDEEAGVELLEDVGDRTLREAAEAASPAGRRALYDEACDLVPRLQGIEDPGEGVAAFQRHLDDALIAYKADLFATWALGELAGYANVAARASVRAAFDAVAREMAHAPKRLAHRDLQSTNLHLVPGRGLVMIDLQGAFLAPPEYDLVCLLRDSYVEITDDEVARQLGRLRPELPDAPGAEEFAHRFDLLTIARKGKDLARFLYAAADRGDARYLPHVPRTLRMLRAAAGRAADRDPRLVGFADLCRELRGTPCAR